MHPRPLAPRLLGALAVALFTAACGGGDGSPTEPTPTPAQLQVVAGGTAQTALAGTAVPVVPAVRVISTAGSPMAGVTVAFTVTGGGSVGAASAQTNADGVASPGSWTLGATAGPNTLTATVGSLTAQFSATGTAVTPSPLLAALVDTDGLAQCVVTPAGALQCWGRNAAALVGDGTTTFRQHPVAVNVGGATVASVDVGFSNACALTTAGAAWCWGVGPAVGSGATGTARHAPTAVAGGHVFTKVVVGIATACGLEADGEVWCWGDQSPTAATGSRPEPTLVSGTLRFTDIGAGGRTTGAFTDQACGIAADGQVYCWGITGIGAGADAARAPAAIGNTAGLVSLAVGRHHACGLTADGTARCWGLNDRGQLGDGSTTTRTTAVAVSGGLKFSAIAAGGWHSCGVVTDGSLRCWGANDWDSQGNGIRSITGVLGNGTTSTAARNTPQPVVSPAGATYQRISAGFVSNCALATNGEVHCWGVEQTPNLAQLFVQTAPVRVLLP